MSKIKAEQVGQPAARNNRCDREHLRRTPQFSIRKYSLDAGMPKEIAKHY